MVIMDRESRPRGRRPAAVAPREEAQVQTPMVASPSHICRHMAIVAGGEQRGNTAQRNALRQSGLCGFLRRLLASGRHTPRGHLAQRGRQVALVARAEGVTGTAAERAQAARVGEGPLDRQRQLVCTIHGIPWRGTPFCAQTFDFPSSGSGVWGPPAPPPHPQRMPAEMHRLLGTLPRRREYELCAPGGCFFPPVDAPAAVLAHGERASPEPAPKYNDELEERFGWFYDRPPASAFRRDGWPPQPVAPQIPPYEPYLHYCLGNLPPRVASSCGADGDASGEEGDRGAGEGGECRTGRRVRASAGTTRISTVPMSSAERARARGQVQSRSSAQLRNAARASPARGSPNPSPLPTPRLSPRPHAHPGQRRSAHRRSARPRRRVAVAASITPGQRAYAAAVARAYAHASGVGAVAAAAMPKRPTAQILRRAHQGLATATLAGEMPRKPSHKRTTDPRHQLPTPAVAVAAATTPCHSTSRRHHRPVPMTPIIRLGALAAAPRKHPVVVEKVMRAEEESKIGEDSSLNRGKGSQCSPTHNTPSGGPSERRRMPDNIHASVTRPDHGANSPPNSRPASGDYKE